ncbi:unnamed protein product [Candidula unifasciata]|uniref:EF-hand domain-containing protein n=1 Tax=Candidula unifasciata TaxID=100452 RepID=A0A8S3YUL2_9EUPU|nr:unnamed protein product [Candidula unifasciata]
MWFCCCPKNTEEEQNPETKHTTPHVASQEPLDVKFKDIKDLFDVFDHNKDGLISREEILINLRALRLPVTYDDVKVMMLRYDTNGDNHLNFLEFTKLIKHYMETKDFPLDGMFAFFDENGDKRINHKEFVKAMRCLGVDMTNEKAREILPEYYVPGTQEVDYENFVRLMKTYLG